MAEVLEKRKGRDRNPTRLMMEARCCRCESSIFGAAEAGKLRDGSTTRSVPFVLLLQTLQKGEGRW